MTRIQHRCPSCNRVFKSITDYPKVVLLAVKRLPIPEAMDFFSTRAAEKTVRHLREEASDTPMFKQAGINMTPEIARACKQPEVSTYLDCLATMAGQEVEPEDLLPPLKPHGVFQWAYPVPKTEILLSLNDEEGPTRDEGTAAVKIHCPGPNLGSAGGPTLQPLGAIALLTYRGVLLSDHPNEAEHRSS